MEAFWGHLELKNRLGGSMDTPFVSDLDLDSSTPPILELKFSIWGPSVRGKQGEPHRPMIPLTGSADIYIYMYIYTVYIYILKTY